MSFEGDSRLFFQVLENVSFIDVSCGFQKEMQCLPHLKLIPSDPTFDSTISRSLGPLIYSFKCAFLEFWANGLFKVFEFLSLYHLQELLLTIAF
jgi:hypothetical protein